MSKSAFYVGTGYGLKKKDLDAIMGEFSISVNLINMIYGQTEWRPTIWLMHGGKGKQYLNLHVNEGYLCLVRKSAWERSDLPDEPLPKRSNIILLEDCPEEPHATANNPHYLDWCDHKPYCTFAEPVGIAAQIALQFGYSELCLLGHNVDGPHFYDNYHASALGDHIVYHEETRLARMAAQEHIEIRNLTKEEDIDWNSLT